MVKVIAIIGGVVVLAVVIAVYYKLPKRLKVNYFQRKWIELQKLCSNKDTWPQAIINADKLVDQALKRRHYSGKSPGERLVSAQRKLSNNDGIWFGHKLRNKIDSQPKMKLREKDVKNALVGFRQALKDIGALPSDKSKKP